MNFLILVDLFIMTSLLFEIRLFSFIVILFIYSRIQNRIEYRVYSIHILLYYITIHILYYIF